MNLFNKRGNVHIDWVISISIFLTFIIVLLSFIKPGYEPKFEGDVLIDMVADNFNEKVNWKVYKTMLNFDCPKGGVVEIPLDTYIPGISGRFKILTKDMNLAKYKGSLAIYLFNGNEKFWVVHNDLTGYDVSPEDPGAISIETSSCKIGAANSLVFEGINQNKLSIAGLEMDKWNFPEFRQFRIQVRESDGDVLNCFTKGIQNENDCKQISIPDEIPVYSADVGEIILDKDLNQEQVILNIEVW